MIRWAMLRKILRAVWLSIALLLILQTRGQAEPARKVALVIGNGAYQHTLPLTNPSRDVASLGSRLRQLSFDVEIAVNLDKAGMEAALHRFVRRINGAELALFYYAGHGLQIAERNYMVPVGAKLERELDIDFELMDVQRSIELMRRSKVLLVFLDACRNNPLVKSLRNSKRGAERGLASMRIDADDLLIAFATSPGKTAEDGTGQNSPFAAALLQHMGTPGIDVQAMMNRVTQSVRQQTSGAQRPWVHASLGHEVYLAGPRLVEAIATEDAVFWRGIQQSQLADDYATYLQRYPNGLFAGLARQRYMSLLRRGDPGVIKHGSAGQREKKGVDSGIQTVVTPD